ncbi:MAG TPA: hypothetical protein VKX46_02895 [Ktedonobacteraceae bacterium]|nr:hypothetical protein [Ktedonobacteraceae bacterium]
MGYYGDHPYAMPIQDVSLPVQTRRLPSATQPRQPASRPPYMPPVQQSHFGPLDAPHEHAAPLLHSGLHNAHETVTRPFRQTDYLPAYAPSTGLAQQGYASGPATRIPATPYPHQTSSEHYQRSVPRSTTETPRQQQRVITLILCLCLGITLLSVGGVVTTALSKSQPASSRVTASTTHTPLPSPTTPADAGFQWCGPSCTAASFRVEYPRTWLSETPAPTITATTVLFTNPQQTDEFAAFRGPQPDTATASTLVTAELQTRFAQQPGFLAAELTPTATIGGETWATGSALYQGGTGTEHVAVYAIVHQQRAYLIEFQAPDAVFNTINSTYYAPMLTTFQFLL